MTQRFWSPSAWLVCCSAVSLLCTTTTVLAKHQEGATEAARRAVVEELLEQMTLEEKVGQMTQADLTGMSGLEEIRELCLGSVLSGGDSDPAGGNTQAAWRETVAACQAEASKTRLSIPLLYGVDAVHGHNNVLGAVIFPHNIGLGCANDADLVRRIGRATAREVRSTGINWAFAPCVTVPRDDRWGRTYEGYSEDPTTVGKLGAALVRGLQGDRLGSTPSVLASAKHWVGDGGVSAEVRASRFQSEIGLYLDQGDTRCDEATLRKVHVAPYLPSIEAGVGSVMVSYSSWNGVKCTVNRQLLTDLLKEELGFEGIVISDYNAIDQCHEDYPTAISMAINAGIDMAMVSKRQREFVGALVGLVRDGAVPQSRIDDAVRRILLVKAAMGLLDSDEGVDSPPADDGFGSPEHRALAREAVSKSLVVLKNESATLPVGDGVKHIAVVGEAATDLGMQCGGWTIDWLGRRGEVTPGGTTLFDGVRELAKGRHKVTYSKSGERLDGADLVIAVVGEEPYAEGHGDRESLALRPEDNELVQRAVESGAPVCLVVLSGRPLELGAAAEACEAVVAAWLPGTEGAGVADVLFGVTPASGRLSFSWPKTSNQHPINTGDASYDPLYPLGHGLTPPLVQRNTAASDPAPEDIGFVRGYTWGWDGQRGDFASPAAADSMAKLAETGIDHICIAFAANMQTPSSAEFQWGDDSARMPSDAEVRGVISLAREHGLKVILKPTVNCDDQTWRAWIGFYRPLTQQEKASGVTGVEDPWGPTTRFREGEAIDTDAWRTWWSHYRQFLEHYARIAEEEGVEAVCIGCEMNSSESFVEDWRSTIQGVRNRYDGLLTYNCNHGRESTVPWWDALDFISVSGYYPTPPPQGVSTKEAALKRTPKPMILAALEGVRRELSELSEKEGKPVLFIETGVTNVRGAARYPWSHPTALMDSPIDDKEQLHYYEAMFETFWDEPWCAGFCWWDWPTKLYTKEAAPTVRSFCVYGREAEQTVRAWYAKERQPTAPESSEAAQQQ